MSCQPGYVYRPTIRPLPPQSVAPVDTLNRSRLFAAGTYFRSIVQGQGENDLSIEITVVPAGPPNVDNITLTVRRLGVIQEAPILTTQTHVLIPPGSPCTGGINALRSAVNTLSTVIEMPSRGIYPAGDFQDGGADVIDNCVIAIVDTPMTGANGPPSLASPAYLDSIFTGNERTIVMIDTAEDPKGFPVLPPPSLRIQQYDGTNFISYCNDVQGACPLEGTC